MLIMGLIIGSFLNVVIYRLPRDISLWAPSSHCPKCSSAIFWYDNIPVVSFFLLAGSCRNCKKKISWRYPLIEGICAIFFLLILWHNYPFTFGFYFLISLVKDVFFISVLIPVFFIDLEHGIIPDGLSYTLVISCVVFSAIQGDFLVSLKGAGVGVGIFLLIFYLSFLFLHRPGMGMGDVKVAAGIGAFLGWKMALISFFLSFLLGALVAGGFLFFRLKGMKDKISFGPFLVSGAFLTFFLGERIVELYFTFFW